MIIVKLKGWDKYIWLNIRCGDNNLKPKNITKHDNSEVIKPVLDAFHHNIRCGDNNLKPKNITKHDNSEVIGPV